MENQSKLKDGFKMVVKEQLKDTASKSMAQHWQEMHDSIQDAINNAASSIKENPLFIQFQKEDIATGATYVAVKEMQNKVASDLLEQVEPIISEFSHKFLEILTEATKEAISELIQEQINAKLDKPKT